MTRAASRWALLCGTAALGGLLSACSSGTETGNPSLTTGPLVTSLPASRPADVELSRALVSLPSTVLSGCSAADPMPSAGAIGVDLLSGAAKPPFSNAGGQACGVVLELGPSLLAAPPELAGLTLLVDGTRDDSVPFRLVSTFAHHLTFDAGPFPPAQGIIAFDLGLWVDAADLGGAAVENGSILVDADHNADHLTALETATPHAVSLYLDENGNGTLDPDELVPIAVPP